MAAPNPWLLQNVQSTGAHPLTQIRAQGKQRQDMLKLKNQLQKRGTGLGGFIGGLAGFIPGLGPLGGFIGSRLGRVGEGLISGNREGEGAFADAFNLPDLLREEAMRKKLQGTTAATTEAQSRSQEAHARMAEEQARRMQIRNRMLENEMRRRVNPYHAPGMSGTGQLPY